MTIAVDAMGGDHAPRAVVDGAYCAATEDGASVLLVGDEGLLRSELQHLRRSKGKRWVDPGEKLSIVHADEVVGMDEEATAPVRRKRRSSIRIAAELVKEGRARALVSAGNTGAVMIAAKMVMGTVPGVERPALAAVFPNASGSTVLLDAGANVDPKLGQLREFAVMGHFYAQEMLGTPSPRIGLLSIGEEASKGNELTRRVFKVLQETGLNFVGNVEGSDLFEGTVDVVVCDGFVGNVVLKAAESLAELLSGMMREELARSLGTRVGGFLVKSALERMRMRTDYREHGAAPLLGVNGGCFIAHGRSDARAIQNAVARAVEYCDADVHAKIADRLTTLHRQEERLLGNLAAAGAGR